MEVIKTTLIGLCYFVFFVWGMAVMFAGPWIAEDPNINIYLKITILLPALILICYGMGKAMRDS